MITDHDNGQVVGHQDGQFAHPEAHHDCQGYAGDGSPRGNVSEMGEDCGTPHWFNQLVPLRQQVEDGEAPVFRVPDPVNVYCCTN